MIVRRAVALSAVLVASFGLPSHAAQTTACRLLVDGAGDASIAPMGPNIAPVDIISADIATGKRNIVGVLRVASLATDPQTASGSVYSLSWSTNGVPHKFDLTVFADGSTTASLSIDSKPGSERPATALVDRATSSIVWTAKRSLDPSLKSARPKLTGLAATAQPSVSNNTGPLTTSIGLNGDSATSGKSYLDQSPSCVKGT